MAGLVIRPIQPGDDPAVASIIPTEIPELGAYGPGFAIHGCNRWVIKEPLP